MQVYKPSMTKSIYMALKVWTACNPSGLDYNYKVGLESHLDVLLPLFNPIEEAEGGPMCILIEGSAGSGKTTLCKFLYNIISSRLKHFHNFSFIRDPPSFPQDKLIDCIFKRVPPSIIRKEYYKNPFLVFLDNINSVKDAQHIAPVLDLVPKNRSTVVIGTRYPALVLPVLPSNAKHRTYTIEGLNRHFSLELFSLRAFQQNHPPKEYIKLAQNAVCRADGSPAKLLRLASQVCLIDENNLRTLVNKEDWESLWNTLESLQGKAITKVPNHGIERNDESKLMSASSEALVNNIASGLRSMEILAYVVNDIESSYLDDIYYRY